MTAITGRRTFLAGTLSLGALALLPGCQTTQGFSLEAAVRQLLALSSRNAFARLTAPGGFFDSQISRIALPGVFAPGTLNGSVLDGLGLRSQLQRVLNGVAEEGADRAAPVVTDAIRSLTIADAAAIVRGGPTAATDYLRGAMGMSLIDVMVPEVGTALRSLSNDVVRNVVNAATGYDLTRLTRDLSDGAEDAIWRSIGAEEAAIRADPGATGNPLLIAIFGFGA